MPGTIAVRKAVGGEVEAALRQGNAEAVGEWSHKFGIPGAAGSLRCVHESALLGGPRHAGSI